MKKILISVFALVLMAVCGLTGLAGKGQKVLAQSVGDDVITYVALGDDNADGYGLSGYNKAENYENSSRPSQSFFVDFSDFLLKKYSSFNENCYARSGDTSQDLKNLIINNQDVREKLANADIVTVSIGANDVLKYVTPQNLMAIVYGQMDSYFEQACANFSNYLNDIVNYLLATTNAKIVFALNYNPYNQINSLPSDFVFYVDQTSVGGEMLSIDKKTFKNLYATVEKYLATTKSASEMKTEYNSINRTIINKVKSLNDIGYTNLMVVDTKAEFDKKESSYETYVATNLTTLNGKTYEAYELISTGEIASSLKWNMTADGNALYSQVIQNHYQQNIFAVKTSYNGGTVNDKDFGFYLYVKNQIVDPTTFAQPTLNNAKFVNWAENSPDGSTFVGKKITQDFSVYAKFAKLINVTFDFVGGVLEEESSKVVDFYEGEFLMPFAGQGSIVKDKFKLVGWTANPSTNEPFSFVDKVVTKPMTLYALWEQTIFEVNANFNGITIGGKEQETYRLEKQEDGSYPVMKEINGLIRSGYRFDGWFTNPNQDEAYRWADSTEITEQNDGITLYAGWVETVNITLNLGSGTPKVVTPDRYSLLKDLKKPVETYRAFYGWYQDENFLNELDDYYILDSAQTIYVKFTKLVCLTPANLRQDFSPATKTISWEIDVRANSTLKWMVGDKVVDTQTTTADGIVSWTYAPEYCGDYVVKCQINDLQPISVQGTNNAIHISYSEPLYMNVIKTKILNRHTFVLELENAFNDLEKQYSYFDPTKFVWLKTEDSFSDEFDEVIGSGFILERSFGSDCKVKLVYRLNDNADPIFESQVVNIEVDNYVSLDMFITICLSVCVLALIALAAVVTRNRYKDYY